MAEINEKKAVELVMRLMAIPGKSGEEQLIAEEVVNLLQEAGVKPSSISWDTAHKKTPLPGEVGNLIVKLPGTRGKQRIMLSAHLDTVPICVGCTPKKTGKVVHSTDSTTGLGADDRAGVAAVLTAVIETLALGEPHPPLTLCFFVQEEVGLQGSRNMTVSKLGNPSMAFNFDGGDPFKLTVGATGGERLKIHLRGKPAHAGLSPEDGASAIHAAGLAIAALQKGKWLGRVRKKNRAGTSNIGIIQGGSATNVVAEHVEIDAEARSHDAEFRTAIADAIELAFEDAAQQVVSSTSTSVRSEIIRRVDYDSFRLSPNSPPVLEAKKAVEQQGQQAELAIADGGVDANWLNKHGIPTVTLGCGQRDVHTKNETLDIPDFLAACRIARSLIANAS